MESVFRLLKDLICPVLKNLFRDFLTSIGRQTVLDNRTRIRLLEQVSVNLKRSQRPESPLGFGFLAQFAAGSHFSAQQVACGEMAEIVGGAEPGGLSAFTGTRRANEEEALLH